MCVCTTGLVDSIASFRDTHQATAHLWSRGSKKLLILIPLNANISHKLEDEDNHICFYDNLPNSEIDRAGVRDRVYKHSVYRVLDEQGKVGDGVNQQRDGFLHIRLCEMTGSYRNKRLSSPSE